MHSHGHQVGLVLGYFTLVVFDGEVGLGGTALRKPDRKTEAWIEGAG